MRKCCLGQLLDVVLAQLPSPNLEDAELIRGRQPLPDDLRNAHLAGWSTIDGLVASNGDEYGVPVRIASAIWS